MREERSLTFLAFVVGENVREDAPGNVLNLMLRNTGIVDELFSTAKLVVPSGSI